MSDASYVNELTPEDAMNILWLHGEKIWEKIDDKIWKRELVGPSWVWAYEAIERLEHGPEPETLIELVEPTEYERNEIYQLWSKLSEKQREKLIRDITRDLAERGFAEFLDTLASGLTTFINMSAESNYERRRVLKDVLDKAYQFLDGKISFDELMNYIAELLSIQERSSHPELFTKGVALGKYLTRTELKKLVDKLLVGDLDRELSKYPEPYW
ncbi:MAG: hypothetical protein RXO24_07815 [Acidilobus sp.]